MTCDNGLPFLWQPKRIKTIQWNWLINITATLRKHWEKWPDIFNLLLSLAFEYFTKKRYFLAQECICVVENCAAAGILISIRSNILPQPMQKSQELFRGNRLIFELKRTYRS